MLKRHGHGCFVFTLHGHIWRPPTEMSGHRTLASGTGGKPQTLKPCSGHWNVVDAVSLASCWYSRNVKWHNYKIEGSDKEVFVNHTKAFRRIGRFKSQNWKSVSKYDLTQNHWYVIGTQTKRKRRSVIIKLCGPFNLPRHLMSFFPRKMHEMCVF